MSRGALQEANTASVLKKEEVVGEYHLLNTLSESTNDVERPCVAINLPISYRSCAGCPTEVESGKLGSLSREPLVAD